MVNSHEYPYKPLSFNKKTTVEYAREICDDRFNIIMEKLENIERRINTLELSTDKMDDQIIKLYNPEHDY